MLPYNEILKVFNGKIRFDIWNNHPKNLISAKSVKGFGSYEHLKFRPMCHIYAIMVTSQTFLLPLCRICVEYIKLDTCAKFDEGGRGGGWEVVWLMTDGSKNPMSIRVNGARFYYDF